MQPRGAGRAAGARPAIPRVRSLTGAVLTPEDRRIMEVMARIGIRGAPPGFALMSDESDDDGDHHRGRPQVVRMIAPGDGPRAATGPTLLAAVLSTGSAPKFSGEEAVWETFSYDWKTYVEILRQAEGGRLKDVHLFEMLRRLRGRCHAEPPQGGVPAGPQPDVCQILAGPGPRVYS